MTQPTMTQITPRETVIREWYPEDPQFWQTRGQGIAQRNLWISIPCLLLAFCVWMLFSTVAVNLNKVGFHFTTEQLFMLTALPSVSGALLRIPYSFVIPLMGGRRWTILSTLVLVIPCVWLGFAVQNLQTSYHEFMVISLLCGFAGANFASSMANISFFFPKARQGGALGLNGGFGNLGVSVMQLLVPVVIFLPILSFTGKGVAQPDGSIIQLQNAPWVWVPFLLIAAGAAWFGMNDLSAAKASLRQQLPVLKRSHLWILSVLYLAAFGSFIGFSAGFAMLSKTQFPSIVILHYAFFGPLLGALARPVGGMLSDRFGGVRVTLINFILMSILSALLFISLPGTGNEGSFPLFFGIFMLLFLTAGLGSGSTFQMIAVIFRGLTLTRVKASGGSNEDAQRSAVTDTAAALGFISAMGAIGGFFIPKAFGTSLELTGSPAGAMKIFVVFYAVCVLITWLCYGRKKSQ
ncbi:NarK family nitrate/nitrite MFS transporter [Prodigiosinella confusarubida]|uniref:Nitrate/nitrite transporter n=1 Tax=Serratia sp. (strain ATCC 39006) TaxID=104623 RepID=A0A2I5T7Q0_SERS3|nr:NarK family nitrate/nitrite MFS transporter [Serratia sp. ATCC 39006]AUH00576.1 NarK family nitrate/nitrite MFS transporter [Serratia sp. ATCC 39006]AUH04897.1 NarK family nitrate/nitrite MFS transporter [Serratia sp. ATCC 39006]